MGLNPTVDLIGTPIYVWHVVRCGSKNEHRKECSKFANYSRLNSQHKLGDAYHHLMSIRIFTLIMHKILI